MINKPWIVHSLTHTLPPSLTEIFLASWFGLTAMYRGDVSLLDTSAHAPNPQIMINMATMYASKDLVGLLVNQRIAKTTVVHHICVFMAYLYVLRWAGRLAAVRCFETEIFSIFQHPH